MKKKGSSTNRERKKNTKKNSRTTNIYSAKHVRIKQKLIAKKDIKKTKSNK